MPDESRRFELLLHESGQLHDNLQRSMGDLNKLAGIMFPVVAGLFTLATGKDGTAGIRNADAGAIFSGISGLIVTAFNVAWMQFLNLAAYKYGEVLPRLYLMARRDGLNFGQYATDNGIVRPMLGVVALQLILLPLGLAAWLAASPLGTIGAAAIIPLALALLTTGISWGVAVRTLREINRSPQRWAADVP